MAKRQRDQKAKRHPFGTGHVGRFSCPPSHCAIYENLLQAALAGAKGSEVKPAAGLGSWANAPDPMHPGPSTAAAMAR
eukprot:6955266-Pyramimonas_sp.AAC.1